MTSLLSQTEYYEHRFSHDPHYLFVGIFSDAGISGAKENRPGFQAMLEKARTGNIDLIYTKSISRFARNTMMLLQVVRELRSIGGGIIFEEQNINALHSEGELMLTVLAGIAEKERKSVRTNVQWAMRNKCLRGEVMVNTNRLDVYFEKENIHTLRSEGEMLLTLIAAVAQNESSNQSENVKWGIRRQYERGQVKSVPSGKFLGYIKDKHGNLIIDSEQATTVRRIYQLCLDGYGAHQIAMILDRENVPMAYGGNARSASHISKVLTNEKYQGDTRFQKSFNADTDVWGNISICCLLIFKKSR